MTISHLWPGVTWATVWDLPYNIWLQYEAAAKRWETDPAFRQTMG